MKNRDLTSEDLVKLIEDRNIQILNLCHIPEDCRLKLVSFTVKNKERIHEILEFGERVDGSSLFSYIDPNRSDIYIKPKLETAFINPFSSIPTLNILCEYLGQNGKPLDTSPQNILRRAEEKLLKSTGITLRASAELEFYVIYKQEEPFFPNVAERNYHESTPFAKFENLRNETLVTLEQVELSAKYGHAEVGRFHSETGYSAEQHEIEFLPQNLSRMAETITIAKWVIRNICTKYGGSASFAPKLAPNHAGNGMHIHLCALRKNMNVMADSKGNVTVESKQMIGGILKFAPSLTAFGNPIPTSYLRFISRKESPMYICWGKQDRLALIRVPLWWSFRKDFKETDSCRRTLEFRGPDPSANIYLVLAGIALAIEYGLNNPEKTMEIADDLKVEKMIGKGKKYRSLPLSCNESAKNLQRDREYYEANGVFPKRVIKGITEKLKSYNDNDLWATIADKPKKIEELLWKYLDCA